MIEAIARAVGDIRSGVAAAMVTNPINKEALYKAGFQHPGHTEFLGTLSAAWTGKPGRPAMMLAGPDLRAVPVTIHMPLHDVPAALSERPDRRDLPHRRGRPQAALRHPLARAWRSPGSIPMPAKAGRSAARNAR